MKKISVVLTLILIVFISYYVYNNYFKKEEINLVEINLKEYSNQVKDIINNKNYNLETTNIDINWLNDNLESIVSCKEVYYSNQDLVLLHDCSINSEGNYYFYDKEYSYNDEYIKLYNDIKSQNIEIEKGNLLKDLSIIDYSYDVLEVNKCATDGICDVGTIFIIQVNQMESYKFYVLEDDGEKVKLIMDKNLVNNVSYAPSDNLLGPVEAIKYLKQATDNWTNILNRNYKVVDNKYNISYENLRATLPSYEDIYKLKDETFIYDNTDKFGYWLSTADSKSFYAFSVTDNNIKVTDVSMDDLGIRPVIEIYK